MFLIGLLVGLWIGTVQALAVIGIGDLLGYHLGLYLPSLSELFSVTVSNPIWEEFIFRGLVLTAVARTGYLVDRGLVRSPRLFLLLVVLVQGIIFGALHLLRFNDPLTFATSAIPGVIYGLLVWRFRSLWPAILAHFSYNFWIMLLA